MRTLLCIVFILFSLPKGVYIVKFPLLKSLNFNGAFLKNHETSIILHNEKHFALYV